MDAATLYMIVTLPNGTQSTSTVEFSTLGKCEAKADWFQLIERRHGAAVTSYRCAEGKMIRRPFYLIACGPRGRPSCESVGLASRQGCTAYKWVDHMRDRSRTAHCYDHDAEPKTVPDGLDQRGQPGVPGAQ